MVKKKDPSIQCSKCIYFFHKKCTSKKDSRGNWKTSLWACHICNPPGSDIPSITLNPNAESFPDPDQTQSSTRPKLPTLLGRHRKSNLDLEHPEQEFLRSQVDTLKGVVSQNDEEIKKLKQSNDLKSKRIIQLESQLQEAKNCITQQARLSSPTPVVEDRNTVDTDLNPRVHLLEQKCSFIIDQISALSSRFGDFTNNSSRNSKNPETLFSCMNCDYDAKSKIELSKHIEEFHSRKYTCNKCDFTSSKSVDVKEHKLKTHPIALLKCDECDMETQHSNQLAKHKRTIHRNSGYRCDTCSYRALHLNDLERHQKTMHEHEVITMNTCNSCSYQAIHEKDLGRHQKTMHGTGYNCAKCEYKADSLFKLNTHTMEEHRQTKTFHATRYNQPTRNYAHATSHNQPSRNYAQKVKETVFQAPKEQPSARIPASVQFHCQGSCSAIQKTFNHEDELKLHTMFYHEQQQPQQ